MNAPEPLLRLVDLSKEYSGKRVVDKVNMSVMRGEIVALIGENGAGKSTLKNILVGLVEPSEGVIVYKGTERSKMRVGDYRIAAVHQELSLFPSLSVAENICITDLPGSRPFVDWNGCRERARKYLAMMDIELDLETSVQILGPGECQLVEIGKALYQEPELLILDEPTTSLSQPERKKLFEVMQALKKRGVGMIFITHFIDEVYEVSDTIVVLRNGVHVGGGVTSQTPRNLVEELLVGRALHQRKLDIGVPKEEVALKVNGFNSDRFVEINFQVRRGEILGIAGLMGAGRTEVIESIYGLRRTRGTLELFGKKYTDWTPGTLRDEGVLFIPEDRRTNGVFPYRPLRENLTSSNLSSFVRRVFPGIGFRGERERAEELARKHRVVFANVEAPIAALSGGNQQKSILARWMSISPSVCLFDDPTRGVDIGAKEEISNGIAQLARNGCAVVIVSSDIKELIELSHRIIVMRKGRFVSEMTKEEFDPKRIISVAATTA
ncbi:MAG TPA: sugar ABC transporter ATP-binding protein [Methanomassiliicoccales archaeon]|nr:sugar ABC transporter ATP-binding protein [Methanomassiliicoccales archaeon]